MVYVPGDSGGVHVPDATGGVHVPGSTPGVHVPADPGGSQKKAKKNAVAEVLSLLDLPGSAVRNTVGDLATGHAGAIIGDTLAHKGVGDYLKDANLPGGIWAKRALGLIGDVGTDPLAYLTFGAAPAAEGAVRELAESGARTLSKDEVARAVLKAAGETGDQGLADLAAKVARRGTGSLSDEEAARIGIRQGAQFGIGNAKVTLPGTGGAARVLDALTAPAKEAVYGGSLSGRLEDVLNAVDPEGKLSRTGLPRAEALSAEGPIKRLVLVDQTRLARGEARAMAQAARAELSDIADRYGKDVVTSRSLWEAVQGAAPASEAVAKAATEVRALLERTRSEASRLAGQEINRLDDYLPVKFGDDLSALVAAKKGGRYAAGPASIKERSVFVDGGKFLGETLHGATPSDVLKHAESIANERFGEGALKLFEDNPAKLIDRYIGGMQRFAEDHRLARNLGTTVDFVKQGVKGGVLGPRLDNASHLQDIVRDHDVIEPLPTMGSPNRAPLDITPVSDEHHLRMEAEGLWHTADLAAEAGDHRAAAVASLEASAKAELASTPPVSADKLRAVLEDGHKVTDTAVAGLRLLNGGDQGWVAESLTNLWKAGAFTDKGWFLKTFDKVTSIWKGLAILSPGFHARNYMGGIFNNALAGVDLASYHAFATEWSAFRAAVDKEVERGATRATAEEAGLRAVSAEHREAFAAMRRYGLLGSTTGRDFADVVEKKASNAVTAANYRASTAVENNLRGTLFLDRMAKGASVEDALGAVGKYHFFYDETSPFFRSFVKRAVPFATWSRFNFPLQIEGIARRPGLYTRFTHLAHNVELGQENSADVPSWMKSLMAIKSPFLAPGSGPLAFGGSGPGRSLFLTPDLPFRDLGETFDVGKLKAQLNPLAKVALEASAGKRFFSDAPFKKGEQQAPATWVPVVAALYALGPLTRHLGLPSIKRHGTSFTLSDADVNKIESLIPVLGRLKRLAPSDPNSQAKAFSSWLSFAFGVSTQTLVENQEAVKAASSKLNGKATADVTAGAPQSAPAPQPHAAPLGGIRPSGSGAPKNAVIAGTYRAKRY